MFATRKKQVAALSAIALVSGCSVLSSSLYPQPEKFAAIELGMTEAEAQAVSTSEILNIDRDIKSGPVAIPEDTTVYRGRISRRIKMSGNTSGDPEGMPAVYYTFIAFTTNESGVPVVTAKRVDVKDIGILSCQPTHSFLCEGVILDWQAY